MRLEMNGMEAIVQNLLQLPLEEVDENRALNKAAKVVQEAVIAEAPIDDGTIKENVNISRAKDGEVKIHSGGAYHAHLVEFGRSAGSKYALKNGKHQKVTWGATAANPYFTRAYEKSKERALQAMEDEIKKALGL